jgi:hypothetical protein
MQDILVVLPLSLYRMNNYIYLSCDVHVVGAAWRAVTEIVAGARYLVQRIGMVAHVRYLVAGRSGGRVILCVVCTVHMEPRSVGFLVEPQNQCRRFVSGLVSKPLGRFLPLWRQNWWRVSWLSLKTKVDGLSVV